MWYKTEDEDPSIEPDWNEFAATHDLQPHEVTRYKTDFDDFHHAGDLIARHTNANGRNMAMIAFDCEPHETPTRWVYRRLPVEERGLFYLADKVHGFRYKTWTEYRLPPPP